MFGQKHFWANVEGQKYFLTESLLVKSCDQTIGNLRLLAGNVAWAKLLLGEIAFGPNCFQAKLLSGEIAFGRNCFWAKLLLGKIAFGPNCFWAKLLLGEIAFGPKSLRLLGGNEKNPNDMKRDSDKGQFPALSVQGRLTEREGSVQLSSSLR